MKRQTLGSERGFVVGIFLASQMLGVSTGSRFSFQSGTAVPLLQQSMHLVLLPGLLPGPFPTRVPKSG